MTLDLSNHPNNVVRVLDSLGYSLRDALPAYPGFDEATLDELLRNCSLALSRPVLRHGILGIHGNKSRFFNVHPQGFRSCGQTEVWPPPRDRTSIFLFGGSTMAGFNVGDADTIAYFFQKRLAESGKDVSVYNFGAGSFKSRQEFSRFLGLVEDGFVPDVAIFLDGVNDCYYPNNQAHEPLRVLLDDLYQREKKRRSLSYVADVLVYIKEAWVRRYGNSPSSLPYEPEKEIPVLTQFIEQAAIQRLLDGNCEQLRAGELPTDVDKLAGPAWRNYLDSIALIRTLAGRYSCVPLFFWQPVPLHRTQPQQRIMPKLFHYYRHEAFSYWIYQWLHIRGFPELSQDPHFFDLSHLAVGFPGVAYVDICHYTAQFSQRIAETMVDKVIAAKVLR